MYVCAHVQFPPVLKNRAPPKATVWFKQWVKTWSIFFMSVCSLQLLSLIQKWVWLRLKCPACSEGMKQSHWSSVYSWKNIRGHGEILHLWQAAHNYKMLGWKHSVVRDRVEIKGEHFPNRNSEVSSGQVCWCSELLNEACNEALPAALMSEHKDHRQDGNNWRAAGVSQFISTWPVMWRTHNSSIF